jgi:hypothetical protein
MPESSLLADVFVEVGMGFGLDKTLLSGIFEILEKNKFVPEGERLHVQSEIEKLVRKYVKENS